MPYNKTMRRYLRGSLEKVDEKKSYGLVPLKDLVPLRPWRSRMARFPELGRGRYLKVKEPVTMEDGSRVYWRVKEKEAEERDFEIPYEGVFEFIQNGVIRNIRRWFDTLVGAICGLKMPD